MATVSQTITINLGICGTCLSTPQQNIVFQLPSTIGHNSVPIIIQLPAHQAASQGPTTAHIVPKIIEGHPSTNALAPAPAPAPQIPPPHNPLPQGQLASSSAASLGGECGLGSCNCGPSCRCVGCVVHPYNSATEDFVFSAYQDLVDLPDRQGQLWDLQQPVLPTPVVAPGASGVDVDWPLDPHFMSESGSLDPAAADAGWNDDFLVVNYPNQADYPSALDFGLTDRCTRRPNCCCVDCVIHCVQATSASDTRG